MTAPASNTPAAIIGDAYFDAGILQEGQTPNSEQLVIGMRKLTDLVNLMQTQGLKLWLNVVTVVPLTAGQSTYTFSLTGDVVMTKPLRVLEAIYVDDCESRRPLNVLSWNDYMRLNNITQEGALNSYFVDKRQTSQVVFFWLTPDTQAALGTVELLHQVQVTNFIQVNETMNFPIEWRIALRWGLADELATGQPQAIMDRCQQRAATYRTMLEDWDVEDAPTRFTPDARSQYYSGSFR